MAYHDDISLKRRTIVRVLTTITCFLLIASVAGQLAKYGFGYDVPHELIRLFYVDTEGNIPTFFSSFLLLFASLLLALISVIKKMSSDVSWRRWAILALGFLCMAVDEASGIHELLNKPGRWLLARGSLDGILHTTWLVFGITIVTILGGVFLKFSLRLPAKTKKDFFVAAAVFLGGLVGMEMVGGFYAGSHGVNNFKYSMLATVEEGLEMAGVITFINGLMNFIVTHHDMRVRFDDSK